MYIRKFEILVENYLLAYKRDDKLIRREGPEQLKTRENARDSKYCKIYLYKHTVHTHIPAQKSLVLSILYLRTFYGSPQSIHDFTKTLHNAL